MLKAIIFDMDGVITDTEYLDFQLQSGFVKQQGGTEDQRRLFGMVGQSYKALYQTMKELIGTKETWQEIRQQYAQFVGDAYERADYRQYFRHDIKKILAYAKENGIMLAVASSSPMAHIRQVLEQCGILNDFDSIISGEGLRQSKPNPEIYVRTLENLGVTGAQAVAVEDSAAGIAAAKGAGIPVIAYVEERLQVDQSQADYHGRDMQEIFGIIRGLCG